MSEATTFGASVQALHALDGQAQQCEAATGSVATGAQAMTSSQAGLDAALTSFKLDRRTMAASKRTQEATAGLEFAAGAAVGSVRGLMELTREALESVSAHRQLAAAVQEHGEAADMGWYRSGR